MRKLSPGDNRVGCPPNGGPTEGESAAASPSSFFQTTSADASVTGALHVKRSQT
jgi:hypothetical protein